jgi:hypothetical protein
MLVNKEKFKTEIFEKRFHGNYNQCARSLGIEVSQIYRLLTDEKSQAGAKMLGVIFAYCEREGLNFRDFIFVKDHYPPH